MSAYSDMDTVTSSAQRLNIWRPNDSPYPTHYWCILPLSTYAPVGGWGGGGVKPSIAYYWQNGGGRVQIACKFAYILNERSLR